MRKSIAFGVAASIQLLAGCERSAVRDAQAAEKRYEIAKSDGTLGEACSAANSVRDAWLKALDQNKYREAEQDALAVCNMARTEGEQTPAVVYQVDNDIQNERRSAESNAADAERKAALSRSLAGQRAASR